MSHAAVPVQRTPARMSGPAFFIADLHLAQALPATAAVFERFARARAREARTLVILGDLFEYWVGDDALGEPFHAHIAALLAELAQAGTSVLLMHGNRDFLLGERFLRAARATLLPDPSVLEIDGRRIALTHGDRLCTRDAAYMRLRRATRARWVQRGFLALPLRWRQRLAQALRARSEADHASAASAHWKDVSPEAVDALFKASGVSTLIHGHTHRPRHHPEPGGERWVLSDWDFDHAPARGSLLRLERGTLSVEPV